MNAARTTMVALSALALLSTAVEADAASARVRCRVRTNPARVQISVDGRALAPGSYTATVTGPNGTVTSAAPIIVVAPVKEAEFDFDSDPANVARGATAVPADFVAAGAKVTGKVSGPTPASGTAACTR